MLLLRRRMVCMWRGLRSDARHNRRSGGGQWQLAGRSLYRLLMMMVFGMVWVLVRVLALSLAVGNKLRWHGCENLQPGPAVCVREDGVGLNALLNPDRVQDDLVGFGRMLSGELLSAVGARIDQNERDRVVGGRDGTPIGGDGVGDGSSVGDFAIDVEEERDAEQRVGEESVFLGLGRLE